MEYNSSTIVNVNQTNFENSTSIDNDLPLLEYLDLEQFLDNDIPVVCILGLLCVLGMFGNAHAFVIFQSFQVSSVTTLITWMVRFDMITCGICIPLEFVQIRYSYTYPSVVLCKITRYFTHLSSLASGILLISIAIERRQKICVPFSWQLSIEKAKYLGIFITLLSASVSAPAAVYYNVEDRKTTYNGTIGQGCRDPKGFLEVKIYAAFVLVIILFGFVLCAVAYGQIIKVIRTQIKTEKARSSPYHEISLSSKLSSEARSRSESIHDLDEISMLQKRKNRKQRYKDSRTITIMLLIATCVSFAGYLLHFMAIIIRTAVQREKREEIQTIYSVLVRGYFLHSAVHPIVYLVVDQKYRNKFKRIYINLFQCFCKYRT